MMYVHPAQDSQLYITPNKAKKRAGTQPMRFPSQPPDCAKLSAAGAELGADRGTSCAWSKALPFYQGRFGRGRSEFWVLKTFWCLNLFGHFVVVLEGKNENSRKIHLNTFIFAVSTWPESQENNQEILQPS